MPKRSKVDHQKFCKPLSKKEHYWLGFLLADGTVITGEKIGNPQIALVLSDRDTEHVKKFVEFMGVPTNFNTNSYNGHGRARGTFRSQKIADNLANFGVCPNKTHTAKVDDRVNNNRHFWRGLIDGDGSVGTDSKNYPEITLTGTKKVCASFLNNVVQKITNSSCSVINNGDSKRVVVCGKYAVKMIKYLYKNNSVSLDRKQKQANKYL